MAVLYLYMNDFYPLENTAVFDRERRLLWNNAAILHAINYYKRQGVAAEYETVLDELRDGKLRAIQALLFGALKASDERITIQRFEKIYRAELLAEYVACVLDGMTQYLPKPMIHDDGADLDPEWPDTQAEVKKKTSKPTGVTGSGSAKKTKSRSSRKQ